MYSKKIKSSNCRYTFEIQMCEGNLGYSARVWDSGGPTLRIAHSIHSVTLEEAEAWIDERARFLGKTEYTVSKTLG